MKSNIWGTTGKKGGKKPTNQLWLHSWGHLQNIKLPGEQITAAGNSHCFENISQRINIQDRMAKFEMLLFYMYVRISIYSHSTFNFPCSSIYFPLKYSWVFGKKANGSAFNSQLTDEADLTHLATLGPHLYLLDFLKLKISLTSLLLWVTLHFCSGSFHIYIMSPAEADISNLGSGKCSETFFLVNSYFSSCQSAKISEMTSLHWDQHARKKRNSIF